MLAWFSPTPEAPLHVHIFLKKLKSRSRAESRNWGPVCRMPPLLPGVPGHLLSSAPQPPALLHRPSLGFQNLVWSQAPSQDEWGERRCRHLDWIDDLRWILLPSLQPQLSPWWLWAIPHSWDNEGALGGWVASQRAWQTRGGPRIATLACGNSEERKRGLWKVPQGSEHSLPLCFQKAREAPGPCWAQVCKTCLRAARAPSAGISQSNNSAPSFLQPALGVGQNSQGNRYLFMYYVFFFKFLPQAFKILENNVHQPHLQHSAKNFMFYREMGESSDI